MTQYLNDPDKPTKLYKIRCPVCHGTGVMGPGPEYGSLCAKCDGSGQIVGKPTES